MKSIPAKKEKKKIYLKIITEFTFTPRGSDWSWAIRSGLLYRLCRSRNGAIGVGVGSQNRASQRHRCQRCGSGLDGGLLMLTGATRIKLPTLKATQTNIISVIGVRRSLLVVSSLFTTVWLHVSRRYLRRNLISHHLLLYQTLLIGKSSDSKVVLTRGLLAGQCLVKGRLAGSWNETSVVWDNEGRSSRGGQGTDTTLLIGAVAT